MFNSCQCPLTIVCCNVMHAFQYVCFVPHHDRYIGLLFLTWLTYSCSEFSSRNKRNLQCFFLYSLERWYNNHDCQVGDTLSENRRWMAEMFAPWMDLLTGCSAWSLLMRCEGDGRHKHTHRERERERERRLCRCALAQRISSAVRLLVLVRQLYCRAGCQVPAGVGPPTTFLTVHALWLPLWLRCCQLVVCSLCMRYYHSLSASINWVAHAKNRNPLRKSMLFLPFCFRSDFNRVLVFFLEKLLRNL